MSTAHQARATTDAGMDQLLRSFRSAASHDVVLAGLTALLVLAVTARFPGFIAWLAWIFVHIFFLIGFRNRLVVLIDWAISYVTYARGARVITGHPRTDPGPHP